MDTKKRIANIPKIISAVQFGSSVSGDTYEGSDIDLLLVVKDEKTEVEKKVRKKLNSEYQIHVYTKEEFLDSARKGDPLSLSIIHTGKVLVNKVFINALKKYQPNRHTAKKCMLNSFAALGLGFSDLIHGLTWDAVNSIYHAARSSIWAILMEQEVTPKNQRVLELLKDNEIRNKYQEIIEFRNHIPDYDMGLNGAEKLWEQEVNEFTDFLAKSCRIIKKNYLQVFQKNFIDPFDLLAIMRKHYEKPQFYSIMLSVNWDKMIPFYHILMMDEKEQVSLIVDAHTGKIKKSMVGIEQLQKTCLSC